MANNTLTTNKSFRRSFLVTLFFVTLASALFWLDTFRAYQSEVRVLVIGKVPTVAIDQVIDNFSELSENLSFYERVLVENDLIEDNFEGYTKDRRRALWNETVQVKRSEKSGVLTVTAVQDTPEQAKRLAEQSAKTLFSVASLYYNIKTDIDLRIVDESITKTVIREPLWYAGASLGSGGIATIFFFVFLSVIPSLFGGRREIASVEEFPVGASVPFLDPRKFVPERPNLSFESTRGEKETLIEKPSPEERMLPGMDAEELPFQFEESYPEEREDVMTDLPVVSGLVDDRVTVEEVSAPAAPQGEPTVEEYKRRLNELLSGGK